MTSKKRRFLLILCVIFFILIAPIIILYSCGYGIDIKAKKIVKTGGFYFETSPQKAEIFIDNKAKGKTDRFIQRLLPKEYQIRISKDGFYEWNKKLRIESQKTTEARNIFLLPKNISKELITDNISDDFSLEQYLQKNKASKNNYEISSQDKSTLPKDQNYQFIISNTRYAALSDDNKLYLFDPDKKEFMLIASEIKQAQFALDNKKLLYYNNNEIWVYFLDEIQIQPYHKKGEKELITRHSKPIERAIWYFDTNEHIIFSVDNKIKFAELDGRDFRNISDICDASPSQMIYWPDDKKLYFTEQNKLYAVSLEAK